MNPQTPSEPNHTYIKIIIIATSSGVSLVSLKVDEEWNENLIAPFLTALHGFSDQKFENTILKSKPMTIRMITAFQGKKPEIR